jgi:hypothetical protein
VFVGEPSVPDTVAILRGLKERYEVHHGVRIQDAALVAAATLSSRYVANRFLPDKAIDLMDEAASKLRIEIDSMPTELDVVIRRLRQLDIERMALENETDAASKERLGALEEEYAGLKEESDQLAARWQAEKQAITKIQNAKQEYEDRRAEAERLERQSDLAGAAALRYGTLPAMAPWSWTHHRRRHARARRAPSGGAFLKEEVGRGGHRRRGEPVDRDPGLQAHGGRGRQVGAHGRSAALSRRRPRRSGQRRGERHSALALGPLGPESADRFVSLPRPDRGGENGAGPGVGGVSLRRRTRHDPHRHE